MCCNISQRSEEVSGKLLEPASGTVHRLLAECRRLLPFREARAISGPVPDVLPGRKRPGTPGISGAHGLRSGENFPEPVGQGVHQSHLRSQDKGWAAGKCQLRASDPSRDAGADPGAVLLPPHWGPERQENADLQGASCGSSETAGAPGS